jgi:putative hydrolase of the HAD superfamily
MGAEPKGRLPCRAVLLDAGGVIVLPHRQLVRRALAAAGVVIDAAQVPRAHYVAVRQLDRGSGEWRGAAYLPALCRALGVAPERTPAAVRALSALEDVRQSGEILWSEPAPHARRTIEALCRTGIAVIVVSNSDGHAADNLRDARVCQAGAGDGAMIAAVIDSELVGAAKPDPRIFRLALEHAGIAPAAAVHVGDMVSVDVAGARAAGITAIHLDPARRCRLRDHRHIRSLAGIWRQVAPAA